MTTTEAVDSASWRSWALSLDVLPCGLRYRVCAVQAAAIGPRQALGSTMAERTQNSRIAVIGAGNVGSTIGGALLKSGFEVKYGSRNPGADRIKQLLKDQPGASAASIPEAAEWASAIILAVPMGSADATIKQAVQPLTVAAKGKVLLDATNPLTPFPDLEVRWGHKTSGGEVIAKALPDTHVYKAFNTLGVEHLAAGDGSTLTGERLTMLFAGPLEGKDLAAKVIAGAGFDPRYVGRIRYARNLEALAELWIHLGVPPITGAETWGRNFHFQVLSKT